ncbi:MAG: class I fructose-bisphosphate aldolase [Phycisphaerae bacterium]|nr:class I fructose-bisphosphate aldolase [Phycisphaerae bacterium]NIR62682.1 class I fructose-bisphosphate aldolase [candidate division Zixibacteria bacterium]NIP51996.1 class I fructose-bisphosphate aldolase [Phycisphaerae bacterium]NIS54821.1 class I fructose-bisphosphate aldolase [Phycisphaerae bacterium]NIU10756.1 class I fructose-bisphosphate aldolase [Phycisphaerae bacterium]
MFDKISEILAEDAGHLLKHKCTTITKDLLALPGPDFIDRIFSAADRSNAVLRNLQTLFNHGRLSGTGHLSILPVDQGIEHSAGASFAPNPQYFDPENIVKLAIEGGCNAVASTVGVLGAVARKYAHKIPFIVKLNHNELLTYPNLYDQRLFASVKRAFDMGAVAVGATVYFGSEQSHRQIEEVSSAFQSAHELGMFTVLWCYLRNKEFKKGDVNYETAADLTGQANHLGVTMQADIIKQKQATCNKGYEVIKFGKTHPLVYEKLTSDHPIDYTRYQIANCYMGKVPMINSGGPSGKNDIQQVVKTAVINKRAGGTGLITGRKAFQKSMKEGVELLNAVQNVYLENRITVA